MLPSNLFFKVYLGYFLLLVILPVESAINVKSSSWIFYGLIIFCAFAGLKMAENFQSIHTDFVKKDVDWRWLVNFITFASSIGVFLLVIDRYFIRGVDVGLNSMEAREAIEQAGSGFVSMLAAYFSSFAAFNYIVIFVAKKKGVLFSGWYVIISIINLLLYVYMSVSLGSRMLLFVVFLLHLFCFLLFHQGKFRIKNYIYICFASIVMLFLFAIIFMNRLSLMEFSPLDSLQISAYAFALRPSDYVLKFLYGNDLLESVGASLYSIVLYIFHGTYEFFYLLQNFEKYYTYGSETFWLPVKIVDSIFHVVEKNDLESLTGYRSGIFTTFAGPLYVDFGVFSPIIIFIIYYFMGLPCKKYYCEGDEWIFIYLQCLVIVVVSPVISLLQSASGVYLFMAGLSVIVFYKIKNIFIIQNNMFSK